MLVDVFVSRQIRQILHFVRKMPIRTSLVFQAAGLQVFPNAGRVIGKRLLWGSN